MDLSKKTYRAIKRIALKRANGEISSERVEPKTEFQFPSHTSVATIQTLLDMGTVEIVADAPITEMDGD